MSKTSSASEEAREKRRAEFLQRVAAATKVERHHEQCVQSQLTCLGKVEEGYRVDVTRLRGEMERDINSMCKAFENAFGALEAWDMDSPVHEMMVSAAINRTLQFEIARAESWKCAIVQVHALAVKLEWQLTQLSRKSRSVREVAQTKLVEIYSLRFPVSDFVHAVIE